MERSRHTETEKRKKRFAKTSDKVSVQLLTLCYYLCTPPASSWPAVPAAPDNRQVARHRPGSARGTPWVACGGQQGERLWSAREWQQLNPKERVDLENFETMNSTCNSAFGNARRGVALEDRSVWRCYCSREFVNCFVV